MVIMSIRQINSNLPASKIMENIKRNKRVCNLKTDASKESFMICKSVTYAGMRNIFTFYFSGRIREVTNTSQITYRVYPGIAVLIASILLGLSVLLGLIDLLFRRGSVVFLLMGASINLLFHILVYSQKITCIKSFELSFQGDKGTTLSPDETAE